VQFLGGERAKIRPQNGPKNITACSHHTTIFIDQFLFWDIKSSVHYYVFTGKMMTKSLNGEKKKPPKVVDMGK
jgi:hypothetical protein